MLRNLLLGQTAADSLYVEDVFSTYLYTGNGSTQTITNGIDLSGKGGLVWGRRRSACAHILVDTERGYNKILKSNEIGGHSTETQISAFNTNGFSLNTTAELNTSSEAIVSWTFRKAAKFFDCVTWTGNGANRTISHALGVVPGLIIVKRTDTTGDWQVYHRSLANTEYMVLNTTAAKATGTTRWNSTTSTATEFSLGTDATVNASGGSYVAYLFAHDTEADGIVQCGSYTGTGASGNKVTLGFEPQFLLIKSASAAYNWHMFDSMRGITDTASAIVYSNLSDAEVSASPVQIEPDGFTIKTTGAATNQNTGTYIYLAIRRGPMRVPTDATKVFKPVARAGTGASATVTGIGFPPDAFIARDRSGSPAVFFDRLRGPKRYLDSSATRTEEAGKDDNLVSFDMDGVTLGADTVQGYINYIWAGTGNPYANWSFRRAPGFFDVTCYSGTGSARTVSHNLGVAPELMIVKRRDTTGDWQVFAGASGEYLVLNTTAAKVSSNTDRWNNTAPTSTVFSLGTNAVVNASGGTYVAYLFATCAGISKVGTYTGTGTTKQIDCGFTNGARFVLIKRTDASGDWYVWDTARGIVSANDPHLSLNSVAAEVTAYDSIDPLSTGFTVNQVAATNVNVNAATYIYLAIA